MFRGSVPVYLVLGVTTSSVILVLIALDVTIVVVFNEGIKEYSPCQRVVANAAKRDT